MAVEIEVWKEYEIDDIARAIEGTDEYKQWKHWEKILKKIGVQLMDDSL